MSCVHYKFSSKLNYDTVTFDGLHISLCDLKRQIMGREKLKAADCDLQITNAQTKEEYTEDALIPKNSLVIVKRIPAGGVKASSKTDVTTPKSHKTLETAFRSRTEPASRTSEAVCKNPISPFFLHTALNSKQRSLVLIFQTLTSSIFQ
ncbi:E3 ubiquitin-protein ligase RBBP6-like isoform X1 [Pezoporus occidentalis]|uniref:E3 ubiquitin-protein ligase RBBP6-like isoform X1 n=1 Tax=Pezoporus occidentalis TaxID=407982 RepID=UPI002F919DF1